MQLDAKKIQKAVKSGKIHFCCFDCAAELRSDPPYSGTFTVRQGICQICQLEKPVTTARKLFGYHNFV